MKQVLAEIALAASLEHLRDIKEMAKYRLCSNARACDQWKSTCNGHFSTSKKNKGVAERRERCLISIINKQRSNVVEREWRLEERFFLIDY